MTYKHATWIAWALVPFVLLFFAVEQKRQRELQDRIDNLEIRLDQCHNEPETN